MSPAATGASGCVRLGSFAPLLPSPGGRPVCIVSPLSHPPSAGLGFDKCFPYCPVKCTCTSTHLYTVLPLWCLNGRQPRRRMLTLYRTECSRELVTSSRMTRCRHTSSPAEGWKTFAWIKRHLWSSPWLKCLDIATVMFSKKICISVLHSR